MLQQTEQLSAFELAESPMYLLVMIRRDLSLLEEKTRSYAITVIVLIITKNQTDFDQSGPERIKQRLPEKLVNTLTDYDTLFINSSSTAFENTGFSSI